LEQGPTEENLIKQARAMNAPLPNKILNAPSLERDLILFYEAFWDLHSCRQIGSAEGPIPWTAIYMYCEQYEMYGEQREEVFYHVKKLDGVYLDHVASKAGG
jgi:hypothetical protein